jgi:hypothetical protein
VRTLIFMLAVLASPAMAIDFRGSELGGTCSSISERESTLGSREIGDPSRQEQHRFTGRVFGRDVLITYLCKDGSLALGDYQALASSPLACTSSARLHSDRFVTLQSLLSSQDT